MSRSQQVTQASAALRLLARRHCDGEMTKSEYRRRRRQLLAELAKDPEQQRIEDSERTLQESDTQLSQGVTQSASWPIVAMVVASLMVVSVMVVLVFSLFD